jgi:hypothetical protein
LESSIPQALCRRLALLLQINIHDGKTAKLDLCYLFKNPGLNWQ